MRHEVTLETLKAELPMVKTLWQTTHKAIPDSCQLWKRIICNQPPFPTMHIFLRMCLALVPVDTVVENAFSRLTGIITDNHPSIGTDSHEQLLILDLDCRTAVKS